LLVLISGCFVVDWGSVFFFYTNHCQALWHFGTATTYVVGLVHWALFGFRQTSRRRLHRLHDFRLPSTDVVDPTAVGGYGPAPSAIFNFISITITIHFISFCIISFSGLHVLGLERTLHDLFPVLPFEAFYTRRL
jgi:hypothetical protein